MEGFLKRNKENILSDEHKLEREKGKEKEKDFLKRI
jgi:hypothetical protein